MWALEIKEPGQGSQLVMASRPAPEPKAHEVLIKTSAAGVNRADIFQRQGLYPPPPGATDIPGLEVSGIVEAVGSKVKSFKKGDKVCALLEGGGYAEFAIAPHTQILPLPNNLDFVEGASLPEALFTAYSNMFDIGHMKRGESLLMHGGTSGIGVMAVQLAKAFGVDCYATAGSDEKCRFLETLGVISAINYKEADFVQEIKNLTQNKGADCIIDIVGGDYFNRNLKILKDNGRLIYLSLLAGGKIEANIAPLLFKNISIIGSTLRNKTPVQKGKIAKALYSKIWPLIENGTIKPVIDSVFSYADADKAHQRMLSGQHIGKIILKNG